MVRMADATYVSGAGANKLVRRSFVIFVTTKPGNTDCIIIPCSLYSVEMSSENLSTKACNEKKICLNKPGQLNRLHFLPLKHCKQRAMAVE